MAGPGKYPDLIVKPDNTALYGTPGTVGNAVSLDEKGVANGVAELNSEGKVSSGQLPISSRFVEKAPEAFGAKKISGSDDSAAIAEAAKAAVESAQSKGESFARVLLGGQYWAERAPVEGGPTLGNSQIPLPVISPETSQKFTLEFLGCGDATAGPHWHQEVSQGAGALIDSYLSSGASGTWGVPSVLGGPTKYADPKGGRSFSNMQLVTNGIAIRQQKNPVVIGCDSRQLAGHNAVKCATLVRATPSELSASLPTNELGIGLYMPLTGNNDNNNIDWYTSYGHYTGLVASEHLVANRIINIYGNKGLILVGIKNEGTGTGLAGEAQHGGTIQYLSSESMKTCHLESVGTSATKYPLMIDLMSCESGEGTYDIVDVENNLYGQINWENITPSVAHPKVNGGKNIKIIDVLTTPPGKVTAPTYKSAETIINPFFRDAFVTLEKVTAVEVDAQVQAVTGECSFVEVPSNKTVKATGAAGKWFWTLR